MYRLTTEAGIPLIPERLHDTRKKRKEASICLIGCILQTVSVCGGCGGGNNHMTKEGPAQAGPFSY